MKTPVWRWLGLIIGMWVLLCAGLLVFVEGELHPDVADPSLRGAASPREVARPARASRPLPEDLAGDGCPVVISVRLVDGAPVESASLELVLMATDGGDPYTVQGESDAAGMARWEDLPCGFVEAEARAEGLSLGRTYGRTDAELPVEEWYITLQAELLAEGVVRDPDGRPIPEAELWSGENVAVSDARGRYRISVEYQMVRLPPQAPAAEGDDTGASGGEASAGAPPGTEAGEERWAGWISADALGYAPSSVDVFEAVGIDAPDGREVYEVDIVLESMREIAVFCAGLPDDDCGDVLMSCTHPYQPFGEPCSRVGSDPPSPLLCTCDLEGTVAIRGGGRSVLVPADEHEAWLDFRDTGSLRGRVVWEGQPPASCRVNLLRIPYGLEDLPRGMVNAHRSTCDADGRFEVLGLSEGDWELVVTGTAPEAGSFDSLERTLVPRFVRAGRVTDVGDVDLGGGGTIEGVLVDGLTDEPLMHQPIIALREGAEEERTTPMGTDTDYDGHFRMQGLPPGSWRVSYMLSPHEFVRVTVREGQVSDGLVVRSSDATALEANGFELYSDEGVLVVDSVDTGSPAMDGGLQAGDEISGVLIGGFDLSGMVGESGPDLTRFILGHWDGPGVTLVVEREGEALEVPLDW